MTEIRRFPLTAVILALLLIPLVATANVFADEPGVDDGAQIESIADGLPPILIAPDDGATTTGESDPPVGVPSFRWEGGDDAVRYHIQVSPSAGFSTPVVDKDTYAQSYTPDLALADGMYYWRVKTQYADGWGPYSETRSFTKDWSDGGQIKPSLVSPAGGAFRVSFSHEDFSWTPVSGAATYLIQISPDPSFNTITYSATTLKARHTPTSRLSNNLYYWRVTPIDRRGNYGQASDVASFTFNWNLAPELLAPNDNVDLRFLPRFSWTAVEAAREYRLEISTQPDFSSAASAFTTDNTDYTPIDSLANDQDYYWRVRAVDYQGNNGPWSSVRQFRAKWDFQPQALTPPNNSIRVSYPVLSWSPVPGAERYQVQIDESTSFDSPIANVNVFNVTSYAHGNWATVVVDGDYFWRVRGMDSHGNVTPWSRVTSFRPSFETSPNPVYPPYYYEPDAANSPVHGETRIAWPVFVWDSALRFDPGTRLAQATDYYELTVDDNPAFLSPNFRVDTAGLAAAPTAANPLTGLADGTLYYWRVRAYAGGGQLGTDMVWLFRYDSSVQQLSFASEMALIAPADGFQAVGCPPVLSWAPVTGANGYRVEISRTPDFSDVVDVATAQFVNYVPWQGRHEAMPFGSYWWRVRPENVADGWSPARRFDLSIDVIAGNRYDSQPPDAPGSILSATTSYQPHMSFVADSASVVPAPYDLSDLHVMLDRTYTGNYNWVIAFRSNAGSSDTIFYGLYFDTDHVDGSGAPTDPLGKPVTTSTLARPEYVLYVDRASGAGYFFRWNGSYWDPMQTLADIGGQVWLDESTSGVQILLPYTAIGSADSAGSGSVALSVFSTSGTESGGIRDTLPEQGTTLWRPAFVSDMLMPLYPFDTPLWNPTTFYDMPMLRWRMPYYDSVDGFQVDIARDAAFTQVVETWESYESMTNSYYTILPAAFRATHAIEDNESYYWRVRIRHERYVSTPSSMFDYGPWSPPMRFKLDSRQVGNPTLSTGSLAEMTPTFSWDRVEGASGYKLQIDDDANFSSPLVNSTLDGTSYTHSRTMADGNYYWRVAMQRSYNVIGHWTPTMSFEIRSLSPTPVSPANDAGMSSQPTLTWEPVLAPPTQPRLAASRYRLQVDDNPSMASPSAYTTESTSYTPAKAQSLTDGTWYWRVAVYDSVSRVGSYSAVQRFYKEYVPPTLLPAIQGSGPTQAPTLQWEPLDGAAYYKVQIADNELFNSATTATTDNTRYTPTAKLKEGAYYWRVQMIDADSKTGPYEVGRVSVGNRVYMPAIW